MDSPVRSFKVKATGMVGNRAASTGGDSTTALEHHERMS